MAKKHKKIQVNLKLMLKILKRITNINKNITFLLRISIIFGVLLGLSEILFVFSLRESLTYFKIYVKL